MTPKVGPFQQVHEDVVPIILHEGIEVHQTATYEPSAKIQQTSTHELS